MKKVQAAGQKRKSTSADSTKASKKPKQDAKKATPKPKLKASKTPKKATKSPKTDEPKSTKKSKPSQSKDGASVHELEVRKREGYTAPMPTRNKKGELIFEDCARLRPNMTPMEVLQAGSFGGTYFRPIKSGVTGK